MAETQKIEFISVTPNMLVADIASAAKFYTEKLGFSLALNAFDNNFVVLKRGGIRLSLMGTALIFRATIWNRATLKT